MTDAQRTEEQRRICEYCGWDNPAEQRACMRCGLWKDHKYVTTRPKRPHWVDRLYWWLVRHGWRFRE
jgi:hypothetical protein